MLATVHGDCAVAARLRGAVQSDIESAVVVAEVDGGRAVTPIERLTDDEIDSCFEQPMQRLIASLQTAFHAGAKRIVVVVPTIGMSGGDRHAVHAAFAEAARVLVKSAARQWGANGVTVNAVALSPDEFDVDVAVSGPVSIAPRALSGDVDPTSLISWLCASAAGHVTGQTIVCDGGLWM